jgi:hypothetical protein
MVNVNFFGRLLKMISIATNGKWKIPLELDINLDNNAQMFVLKPSGHFGVTGTKNYKNKK